MREGKAKGLKMNIEKTNIIRFDGKKMTENVGVGSYEFEQIDKFKFKRECTERVELLLIQKFSKK